MRRGVKRKRSKTLSDAISTDCLRLIISFLPDPASVWNLSCTSALFAKLCHEHPVKTFWIMRLFDNISAPLAAEIIRTLNRQDLTFARLSGGLATQRCEFCRGPQVEHLSFPLNLLLCPTCIGVYTIPVHVFHSPYGLVVRGAIEQLPQTRLLLNDNQVSYQVLQLSPQPWVPKSSTALHVLEQYGFDNLADMKQKINAVTLATLDQVIPTFVQKYAPFLHASLLPEVKEFIDPYLFNTRGFQTAIKNHNYKDPSLIAHVSDWELSSGTKLELGNRFRALHYRFLKEHSPLVKNFTTLLPLSSFNPHAETLATVQAKYQEYFQAEHTFLQRQRKLPIELRIHRKNQLGWDGAADTSYETWRHQSETFALQCTDPTIAHIVAQVLHPNSSLTWHRAVAEQSRRYCHHLIARCAELPPLPSTRPPFHLPGFLSKKVKQRYPAMAPKTLRCLARDIIRVGGQKILYVILRKKDFTSLLRAVHQFRLSEYKTEHPTNPNVDPNTFLENVD